MKLIILAVISVLFPVFASSKYEELYQLPKTQYSFPLNKSETIYVNKVLSNYKVLFPYNETIRNYSFLYLAAHKVKTNDDTIEVVFKSNNIAFSRLKGDFDKPTFYKIALPKIDTKTVEISTNSNLYIYQIYLVK